MKKIAFIYKNSCHPVSNTYANAINAVHYKITGPFSAFWQALTIPDYDYYFVETSMSLFLPIIKKKLGKKCIIIFRANDGLFGEKTTKAYLGTKNPLKKQILLYLIKNIDGLIAESEVQIPEIKEYTQSPVVVCESYVENKEFLKNISPNLHTNTFLFIGAYRPPFDHKNIEYLIEIFNDMPEFKLIIIGGGTEKLKSRAKENIDIKGFVKNKDQYYTQATYYIHLPKYEAGPITLLEAGTAGLNVITSGTACHANLVEKIDPNLVLKKELVLNPEKKEEAKKHIRDIVSYSDTKKQDLSEKFKNSFIPHYQEPQMVQKFKEQWAALIKLCEQND